MGFLGEIAKNSLMRAMSDKCPYRDMCPSHHVETCRKVEQEVLDCGYYDMFSQQEQEDRSDIYQGGSSSSSSSYSDYEEESERKRRQEDEECRRLEHEIAELERANEKWIEIMDVDNMPTANGFLREIEKCRQGAQNANLFSDVKKASDYVASGFNLRIKCLIDHAEKNYPDAPEYLAYKAEEEARKKKVEEAAAAKEAAIKAKEVAKKRDAKVKKLLGASKRDEQVIIQEEVSLIKRKVFVIYGVAAIIIAIFLWFLIFIFIAAGCFLYPKLDDWITPKVKAKLLAEGKIKSEKQWAEEELKIAQELEKNED